MKLTLKLSLAIVVSTFVVLAIQATIQLRWVAEIQQRENREELMALARSLAAGYESLQRHGGKQAAKEFLHHADTRRGNTHFLIEAGGRSGVTVAAGMLTVRVPLGSTRQLVASRALTDQREATEKLVWRQLTISALLLLGCAVVIVLIAARTVGRRVNALVAQANAVGDGSYEVSAARYGRDELGDLARTLDGMVARLAAARQTIRLERRTQTELLDQLRHADRLSTVGKLASSIAHEVGTPLNVIAGRASLISFQIPDDAAPELAEHARIIEEQARRIEQIIRQLLDFGRRAIALRPQELGELLRQARTVLEPLADDRKVVLTQQESGELSASVDSAKLLQVVTNLMINAIQAMPEGGRLTLGAETQHIEQPPERRARPGDYVVLRVQDEGVGMDASQIEKIFNPFFTTKAEGQGTGLGLSVSHGIVREHGGWIEVESTPGVGSTFSVYIPAHSDAPAD